uniref:Prostate and testis expressed 1 n=1 Tax=Rousettus aegyptiacus TaxID=9407 RepID=A0A7J8H424_ROUAE|nr:prostate and testis expressed 1 [Rousettus aegyptiacus]
MNKSLLLELLILLCCFRVLSGSFLKHEPTITIRCRTCHIQFPREECFTGRGVCAAKSDEACVTGRIFKGDGSPFLSFKGCQKCANVNGIKWSNYSVNLRCCKGYNLCNENI